MHSLIECICTHEYACVVCVHQQNPSLNPCIAHAHTLFDIDFSFTSKALPSLEKCPRIFNKTGIFMPSSGREQALMIDENGKNGSCIHTHSSTLYE